MLRNVTNSQLVVALGMAMICAIALYSCTQDAVQGATVRCTLDKSVLCQQRKECTKCTSCTDKNDSCCCLHVDKCACNINKDSTKGECCE